MLTLLPKCGCPTFIVTTVLFCECYCRFDFCICRCCQYASTRQQHYLMAVLHYCVFNLAKACFELAAASPTTMETETFGDSSSSYSDENRCKSILLRVCTKVTEPDKETKKKRKQRKNEINK
jgi:hypothetical protein